MRLSGASALAAATFLLLSPGASAALATPALDPGQDIRVENGEVAVPGAGNVTVVRYTWRDSAGFPRSVSLVPAAATTGYAVQMTYTIGGGAPVVLNSNPNDPNGDGGFGYFVSHELFRNFTDGSNAPIAAKFGFGDDSPLGRNLASTGTAQWIGSNQATHEYRLNYPRASTKVAVADPDAPLSTNANDYQVLQLPVIIRWHFVAGRDYPLWTFEYDLSSVTGKVANDVRAPYGVMAFNEGVGPAVTALRWGDFQHFVADAGASEFSASASAGTLDWTWNAANTGKRYNVMSSGNYEFGLVQTVPVASSKYADGYSPSRKFTKATSPAPCADGDIFNSLPCPWEWAYQSFQYDYGPPARPKIAWGTSPYLGTGLTEVYTSDVPTTNEALDGTGRISYGVQLVMGKQGAGAPLTLARADAVEGNVNLTLNISSGRGYVCEVLGRGVGSCNFASNMSLPRWSSIVISMIPNTGFTAGAWTGPCAGMTGLTCAFTLDQSATVSGSTVFNAGVSASPSPLDFGGQSMGTTSPPKTVTVTNNTAGTVTVTGVTTSGSYFAQTNNCSTLAVGASCAIDVTFTGVISPGTPLNGTTTANATLDISTTNGNPQVGLAGISEKSFVTHYYRSILGREPDSGGKSFWTGEMMRLQLIGADINEVWYGMALQFFASAEYAGRNRDNAGFVSDLYRTFFNRAPDTDGANFWLSNLAQGMPREVVLTEFLFSAEFVNLAQAVFGNTSVPPERNIVSDFYRGLLGRVPDNDGFNYWVSQFRGARCTGNATAVYAAVESISSQFAFGAEAAARARSNSQFVGDLYNAFLRRGGDLAGVQYWIGQLNGGTMTRDQLRQQFRVSPEFSGRVNTMLGGC